MRLGNLTRFSTLAVAALSLSACGAFDGIFGSKKNAPDEFSVVAQQPLAMPPNADLRPPRPGAPRPQDAATRDQARSIVTGTPTGTAPGAGGSAEQALLQHAGADKADPEVRNRVNLETRQLNDNDRTFIDSLIFWREQEKSGLVVDAAKEQNRLRTTQAVGQPPTSGGQTPTIERRKRGLLEGIF